MKTRQYQRRLYRDWVRAEDLFREHIVEGESDLQILTDRPLDRNFVKKRLHVYRQVIEDYIHKDRRFQTSLKPIEIEVRAPRIIKVMAAGSRKAGVGPMATVAGAISGPAGFWIGEGLQGCRY